MISSARIAVLSAMNSAFAVPFAPTSGVLILVAYARSLTGTSLGQALLHPGKLRFHTPIVDG